MKKSGNRVTEGPSDEKLRPVAGFKPLQYKEPENDEYLDDDDDELELLQTEITENDRRPGSEVLESEPLESVFVMSSAPREEKLVLNKKVPERSASPEAKPKPVKAAVRKAPEARAERPERIELKERPARVDKPVRPAEGAKGQVRKAPEGVKRPEPKKQADVNRDMNIKRVKPAKRKKSKLVPALIIILTVLVLAAAGGLVWYKMAGHKGAYGDCSWNLDNKGVLTVTGNGSMSGSSSTTFGWGKPDMSSVKELIISEGVTDIPEFFTADMPNLTKVSVPSTVSTIGRGALCKSPSVTDITVAEGNEYFSSVDGSLYTKGQTELIAYASGKADTEFAIPDSVETIGYDAFDNSVNLQTIRLSAGLINISPMAFNGCKSLSSFVMSEENTNFRAVDGVLYNSTGNEIIRYAPALTADSFAVPENVTKLADGAFEECTNLREIVIPEGLLFVGNSCFYGCSSLDHVELPDSVFYIGGNTFAQCTGLNRVVLPANITYIPSNMLWGCKGIADITIPETVTEIRDGAFCSTSVSSVVIPEGVTSIGNNAFGDCASLVSVNLPDGLTGISDYAFNKCTSLSEIAIPDTVTSIGYASFSGCTSLKLVAVPDTVTSIGDFAFNGCTGLTTVTIGSGVASVGRGAFKDCTAITSATYNGSQASWGSVSVGEDNKPLTKTLRYL